MPSISLGPAVMLSSSLPLSNQHAGALLIVVGHAGKELPLAGLQMQNCLP